MNIYIILLMVLVFFLLNYIMNNKEQLQDKFGNTDFFHRSFMTGLGLEQRKKDLKKIYDFYGLKENFEGDTKEIEDIKEAKKLDKEVVLQLPKKPTFELEDLKYDDQKHITNEKQELSSYQEVQDYDTGSGDLNSIHKVFRDFEKNGMIEDLKLLDSRGGNVHMTKKLKQKLQKQ